MPPRVALSNVFSSVALHVAWIPCIKQQRIAFGSNCSLSSLDEGEFVDSEMKADALKNFDKLFYEYGADREKATEENWGHWAINMVLKAMLSFIVISGVALSATFLLAESPAHQGGWDVSSSRGRLHPNRVQAGTI